jgi:hypothetical protein
MLSSREALPLIEYAGLTSRGVKSLDLGELAFS